MMKALHLSVPAYHCIFKQQNGLHVGYAGEQAANARTCKPVPPISRSKQVSDALFAQVISIAANAAQNGRKALRSASAPLPRPSARSAPTTVCSRSRREVSLGRVARLGDELAQRSG